MRILAVTPYYSPDGGGLERYAHEILRRRVRDGDVVQVLTFARREAGVTAQDGVDVHRLRPLFRVGNTPVHPNFTARTAEAIGAFSPDVIVAHTPVPFPAEMAYWAAERAGVPFVVTYHAGRLRGSSPALEVAAAIDRATFERRMLAGASRLIAVSSFVRDHALADEKDRVVVVPPGVDADRFVPDGPAVGPEVLFVGPLSESYRWKGVDVLWHAMERVAQAIPDVRLRLVGAGDRVDEFAARAERASFALDLAGRLSEEALVAAYQRAAVTVLPSTTDAESFGMVLAEANACGRPVVGSRVGGIPDFVRDEENGLLAAPGDAEDLAEAISRVLGDAALAHRLGAAGRRRVVAQHDWERLAEATGRVLDDAVAVGPPAPTPV